MSDKLSAEVHYLRIALSEALRVLDKDKGQGFVDRLIEKTFEIHNIQERTLDAFDKLAPADHDRNGRAAVMRAVKSARENPTPIL